MHIGDLLIADRVDAALAAGSRKRALELISDIAAAHNDQNLAQADIFTSLIGRERLGSTGVGHGVALPHARVPGTERALGIFVRLEQAIDFDAIDGKPVDMMFALVVPEDSADEHLSILAQLAQMFSNKEFCNRLRAASDAGELLSLIRGWSPD